MSVKVLQPNPAIAKMDVAELLDECLVKIGADRGVQVITVGNLLMAGLPTCRCCVTIEEETAIVLAGGACEVPLTDAWVASGAYAQWVGDVNLIAEVLDEAGISYTRPDSDAQCFVLLFDDDTVAECTQNVKDAVCPQCEEITVNDGLCDDCQPSCEHCGSLELDPGDALCWLCYENDEEDDG